MNYITIIGLFVLLVCVICCFFYIKDACEVKLKIKPLNTNLIIVIAIIISSIFLPKFLLFLLKYFGIFVKNSIDNVFQMIMMLECSGLVFLMLCLKFVFNSKASNIKFEVGCFKIAFVEFLKIIPTVFLAIIFWYFVAKMLINIGIKIYIGFQPIVNLLLNNKFEMLQLVYAFIVIVVIGPICEEILFRYILLRYLCKKYSITVSLVVSSFVFSVLHMHFLSFLPIFILGYSFGLAFAKCQNLLVPIFMHSLFNCVNFCALMMLH